MRNKRKSDKLMHCPKLPGYPKLPRLTVYRMCKDLGELLNIFTFLDRDAAISFSARERLAGGFSGKHNLGDILSFKVLAGYSQTSAIVPRIAWQLNPAHKYSKRFGTLIKESQTGGPKGYPARIVTTHKSYKNPIWFGMYSGNYKNNQQIKPNTAKECNRQSIRQSYQNPERKIYWFRSFSLRLSDFPFNFQE